MFYKQCENPDWSEGRMERREGKGRREGEEEEGREGEGKERRESPLQTGVIWASQEEFLMIKLKMHEASKEAEQNSTRDI